MKTIRIILYWWCTELTDRYGNIDKKAMRADIPFLSRKNPSIKGSIKWFSLDIRFPFIRLEFSVSRTCWIKAMASYHTPKFYPRSTTTQQRIGTISKKTLLSTHVQLAFAWHVNISIIAATGIAERFLLVIYTNVLFLMEII